MQACRLIFLAILLFEANAETRGRSSFRGGQNFHIRQEQRNPRVIGGVKLAKTLPSLRIEIETETKTGINNTHMNSDASDSSPSPSYKSIQNEVHFYQTTSFIVCCCLILVFFCCLITTFCARPTRCFGLYKLQSRLSFDDRFTDNDTNNNNENTRNSSDLSLSSNHNLDTSNSSRTSSRTSHQHDQDISRIEANIVKFKKQEQRMKKKLLVSKWRNYRMVITSKDLLPLPSIFDTSLDTTKNTATIHTTLKAIDKPTNPNHITITTTSVDDNVVAEDCRHHPFLSEEDSCRLILPVIVTTNQTSALTSTNSTQTLGRSLNQGNDENSTNGADSRINNNLTTDMSKETDIPLNSKCSSATKHQKSQPPQQMEEVENGNRQVSGHCAICLCAYKVGDVAVWSNNLECPHVFHEECILQWMLMTNNYRNSLCPCCRQHFVLDNTTDGTSSAGAINAVVSDDCSGFSSISSSKFIFDSSNCSEPLAMVTHEDQSVPLSRTLSSQNDEMGVDTLNVFSGSTSE